MSKLFQKFDLHGLALANRIVMAPMTRSRAGADGVPSSLAVEYYRQRAGAGLIITEATAVSKQGSGYPNIPGIWNDDQTKEWKKITDAVHTEGGKIFLQVFHTGRIAHSSLTGEIPVSSIDQSPDGQIMTKDYAMQAYETPRILYEDEMPIIVGQFHLAAENAKKAGFDGVEIHAANGYLLDQFLRDGTNRRTDKYGGSVENRMRLLCEVIEAGIAVFGAHRVGVRLSPNSAFNSMKDSNPLETYKEVARKMNTYPLAYLHMVESVTGNSVTKAIRDIYKNIMMVNQELTKESGENLLNEGAADLISFGKSYISNPDLVERFKNDFPLAKPDPTTFYGGDAKGYTDYAFYRE